MRQIAQEFDRALEPLGEGGVRWSFSAQFKDIKDLATRGQHPAQGIRQRERHPLPRALIELRAIRVPGGLEMV